MILDSTISFLHRDQNALGDPLLLAVPNKNHFMGRGRITLQTSIWILEEHAFFLRFAYGLPAPDPAPNMGILPSIQAEGLPHKCQLYLKKSFLGGIADINEKAGQLMVPRQTQTRLYNPQQGGFALWVLI